MDEAARSAGEHAYKEIQVKVWPSPGGARYAVSVRSRRGGDLVWDRRLCTASVPAGASAAVTSVAGVLRAVAAALAAAADHVERLS